MRVTEYVVSVLVAMSLLAAVGAWTHGTHRRSEGATGCGAAAQLEPVTLKGMSLYGPCPSKRG